MNKVAIIGGGAAGLCCAIMIKQLNKNIDVTIFEKNDRVAKKLSITGNGRCNITNQNLTENKYHGETDFAINTINRFDFNKQKDFFNSIGLPFSIENDGKAYPMSYQASSVVDILRFEASDLNVKILLSNNVKDITRKNDLFIVNSNDKLYEYSSVVLATGSNAGLKVSDFSGYDILKKFGHKIEPLFPSLVQIKTETDLVKQLKGIKVQGKITIDSSEGIKSEFGEILFCDYGLSGPPTLQISRLAKGNSPEIVIDILPDFTQNNLKKIINQRINHNPNRIASELFTGFMNKRLGQVILKKSGCNINDCCNKITDKQIDLIVKNIKFFKLKVLGTTGFENAQVSAGGAQTAQFFDNMMSKKVKGLFAIGEILNVDGDCGGYNLAFAWSSANAAARGISDYLSKKEK